jgi:glycosyltransferase involved in cell wall biosynthesis
VVALTPKVQKTAMWNGVRILHYGIRRSSSKDAHPWIVDLETKIIRGEACYDAAIKLRNSGFTPDVILAHHGWGESLFPKDVWPTARMGLYCELYHHAAYPHMGFDPEFDPGIHGKDALRMRIRNQNNHLHFPIAEAGLSPTHFQADTFPPSFRKRITVQHDGIDTDLVAPKPDAELELDNGAKLTRDDEVITFINHNLEPYRGYHIFMRALPELLKKRPNAQVVMLGGDETSYGARPPKGKTWKQIFIDEVRDKISDQDWKRVHYLGRVPYGRFLNMMQVSRVRIYLTYPFVLSWSLLEAMSAGAAIVASDTAPVKEAMVDGETGLFIDFFDQVGLVEKTCQLLDDKALREKLGTAARQHIVDHYDLKRTCLPKHLEWVDQLAKQPVLGPDQFIS